MSLRQIPRGSFDKGLETSRKTAIVQMEFIAQNIKTLQLIDLKSKPHPWKVKRFFEMTDKLKNNIPLDLVECNFMDEFYEAVISKVYNVPGFKKEFYKGHRR